MKTHFDESAKTWDQKPDRLERAQKLADEIINLTAGHDIKSAMEFGAGTGLVSFCLKDHFQSITMIDDSAGMIEEIRKKIMTAGTSRLKALRINLLADEYHERHDIIYSLLVLHHIHDMDAILKKFYNALNPGGLLCIGDLVTEDGSFHAGHPDFDGHRGFDTDALTGKLSATGFAGIQSKLFYSISKVINGEKKTFPLFFLSTQK